MRCCAITFSESLAGHHNQDGGRRRYVKPPHWNTHPISLRIVLLVTFMRYLADEAWNSCTGLLFRCYLCIVSLSTWAYFGTTVHCSYWVLKFISETLLEYTIRGGHTVQHVVALHSSWLPLLSQSLKMVLSLLLQRDWCFRLWTRAESNLSRTSAVPMPLRPRKRYRTLFYLSNREKTFVSFNSKRNTFALKP